jgi:hypothetical protein
MAKILKTYLSAITPKAADPTTIPAKCMVPTKASCHWFSLHVTDHLKIIERLEIDSKLPILNLPLQQ